MNYELSGWEAGRWRWYKRFEIVGLEDMDAGEEKCRC
jgi:hypothetical protein